MKPSFFLKIKGLNILPFGIAMLFAPELVASLVGAEFGSEIGVLFARLYGILLISMGFEMMRTKDGHMPEPIFLLVCTICDVTATTLCVVGFFQMEANIFYWALPGVYVLSTLGFFTSYLTARKANA